MIHSRSSSGASSNTTSSSLVGSTESSPKTPKSSPSSLVSNGVYYKIQPCSKCWKKAEEYQESTCFCKECDLYLCKFHTKTHLKKCSHHHIFPHDSVQNSLVSPLSLNTISPSQHQPSPLSARKKPPKCILHSVAINTVCKTCQSLICAACSVDSHKGHDIFLIENIEAEEKLKMTQELSELENSVNEWESMHGLEPNKTNDQCQFYLNKISKMKLRMKQQSNEFYENVQRVVREKQEKLNESIEKKCLEYEMIVREIATLKKDVKLLYLEFASLSDMSGYELLERKHRKYYKTLQEFEKIKLLFQFTDISDLYENQLMDLSEIVEEIRTELEHFSSVSNIMKRRVIPRTIAYSHSLEQQENEKNNLSNPYDVKISHLLNVLLVSDYFNSRIMVYDLKTKKFKGSIKTFFRPHCLYIIEEDIRGDAVSSPKSPSSASSRTSIFIGSNDRSVYKFNLEQLLKISIIDKQSQFYEWKQSSGIISYPSGMTFCKNSKLLFVCDYNNNCIHLLNSQTGQPIHRLDQSTCGINFSSPWGIDMTLNGDLIVSETGSNKIQIFKLSITPESPLATGVNFKNNYQAELKYSFGKSGSSIGEFNFVRGLLYDKVSRQLLICDSSNKRIELFDESGGYLHSFKSEHLQGPYGMCMNEVNNELYVADYSKKKVHIFNVT
ncbi:predicted protein [Naegleria gruberi]|uniref:Predicted protein n=1 Tax=Naegleria gruberi TaxID=5762 RepID=D2V1B6_NAEGR|nr:uncharacterized protein NAEGRDRAFT_62828 [Naegleria gruberi]EFC49442.1 predicted protein [Naegleria gruberi]|eukprot:XP_002682186.1 predicted protein [Naegleria gruberi strain NEG-M]